MPSISRPWGLSGDSFGLFLELSGILLLCLEDWSPSLGSFSFFLALPLIFSFSLPHCDFQLLFLPIHRCTFAPCFFRTAFCAVLRFFYFTLVHLLQAEPSVDTMALESLSLDDLGYFLVSLLLKIDECQFGLWARSSSCMILHTLFACILAMES
jgi:hypothetical protein